MPTYEYRCEKGHTFEEFQSILADPVQVCPICGAHVERIVSGGTGLIFKGSGFYITDYARKNSSGSPHSAKHGDSGASAPASESKPASDTPAKTESSAPAEKAPDKKSKPES